MGVSASFERSSDSFFSRELSWLAFARRVLALVEDESLPLYERIKFTGIVGMLHDEFYMKRMSGLARKIRKGSRKLSMDGRSCEEELAACAEVLDEQRTLLDRALGDQIRPAMAAAGLPILDYGELEKSQRRALRETFRESILPILTPLAVDAEHPFPFIRNLGLNLAILLPKSDRKKTRFVRLKVPENRPRWLAIPGRSGFVPIEQVISENLDLLFPATPPREVYAFRVTRGVQGEREEDLTEEELRVPGSIVRLVSSELRARRFAGAVRLEVDDRMPASVVSWLSERLEIEASSVARTSGPLRLDNLADLELPDRPELCLEPHRPRTHERLKGLERRDHDAIFQEIDRGDLLLHHPYHAFDTSVLRFLESAAVDPKVLAIKLTIYRTSRDSPIVQALAEAARRGKQVAVLVEITARFDEAPNIAWGKFLENEGVHVAYGIEKLKTHVKLALVVREQEEGIRRYAHVGTGNYHTGTARIYEDLGMLSSDPVLCADVAAVFNQLTGATLHESYQRLLVAPSTMLPRFVELIRREAAHARAGRPCGIQAKMNQLQEADLIEELYAASQAGVPISLNVRGLCCLRPGVAGLSENIRVFSIVGRFLEHSRIYRFVNGGEPELFLGSADWMRRNLRRRVETITPVRDGAIRAELEHILEIYESDNASAWDCLPDGSYRRRQPDEGDTARAAQEVFIREVAGEPALV